MPRFQVSRRVLGFRALIAIMVAALFAVLEQVGDVYLAHSGMSHADILADDVIGAVLLGTIAFLWVTVVDERNRRIRAEERHELTAEMNHHIRNALTVIKYAAQSENAEERLRMIDESVERIDDTLRELLPVRPEVSTRPAATANPPARGAI